MKKLILIPMVIYTIMVFNENCNFENAIEEPEEIKPIEVILYER